jgi:predicted aldo/keto reductase-like oxidoreductase
MQAPQLELLKKWMHEKGIGWNRNVVLEAGSAGFCVRAAEPICSGVQLCNIPKTAVRLWNPIHLLLPS